MSRVYVVTDRAVVIGVGYARAKSKAEAIEKAKQGLVEFVYEPGDSTLSAALIRDPQEAAYNDPGEEGWIFPGP